MSYLLAFAGFAALVILHELGHFAAAKAVGMRVERFSLFFPPLLWRWRPKNSETEYAIGAIPLGGYVKITGMSPEEEMAPEVAPRAYLRQKVWKRIVVIFAGPLVNIVLAFLILWGLYSLTTLTFTQPVVEKLTAGSPAAQVLEPGDRIVSVDGTPGYSAGLRPEDAPDRVSELMESIVTHTCAGTPKVGCRATEPVRFEVLRDGRTLRYEVTPRFTRPPPSENAAAGAKPPPGRMLVGLQFDRQSVDFGTLEAARYGSETMWKVTTVTVDSLVKLFYDKEARDQVSGVVGSYEATRQSFEFDTKQRDLRARADLAVAGHHQPVSVSAPRRRTHLLGAGREAARQADPVPDHGARRGRRLHARAVPVLRRPVQRHRAVEQRRGLRRALTSRSFGVFASPCEAIAPNAYGFWMRSRSSSGGDSHSASSSPGAIARSAAATPSK